MSRKSINTIIARVLRKSPEGQDMKLLEEWMSESETNRKSYLLLKEKWEKTYVFSSYVNSDRIYKKVQNGINEQRCSRRNLWFNSVLKIAAIVPILIGMSLIFYLVKNESEQSPDKMLVQQEIKENPKGVKSQIQLPDGTRVWLNAASRISYPEDFTNSERLVSLQGEAYFEVVKDEKRPFSVITDQVVTTALGTSFNIKAYNNEAIEVFLSTGKVDVFVKSTNKHVLLMSGQQVNTDDSSLSVSEVENEIVLAWKDGKIIFDDTEFDEMISVLTKWYDVIFVVENLSSQKQQTISINGEFENQNLQNVLKLLSHSMNFEYSTNKNIITLTFLN